MGRIRVLHVDDDPAFTDVTAAFLREDAEGFEVVTETQAEAALDYLRENGDVDCLVSDYALPRMDGIELLETVREEFPHLPFILFTGRGSESVASEALASGATNYLKKQSGTEQYELLANKIENAVEQYRTAQEREKSKHYRRQLYEAASDPDLGIEERAHRLLELGCERLGVENGHIVQIDPETGRHAVRMAAGSEFVRAGTVSDLDETFCRKTIASEDILAVYDAPGTGWKDDPAHEKWDIGCYIGGEIEIDGELYGTLCFVNRQPRDRAFTEAERSFVDLTTRWLGQMFERREHERNRREYREVVDTVPDGVYVMNDDFEFAMVNDGMETLTGYSREELVGSHGSLVFDEETVETAQQEREALPVDEGDYKSLETEMQTADGGARPCEIRARLLSGTGDEPRRTAGVVRDISERAEYDRRLQRAETMFEHAQDALFLVDVGDEFTVQQVNPAYEEMTDISIEEIRGKTPRDVLGDDAGAEVEERYRTCVERREPLAYEEELPIGEGTTLWETRIAPVVVDESVDKLVGATRDITERKQREQRLAESEARYRTLTENVPNGAVFYVDEDFRYRLVSGQGFEPLETDPEDLEGNRISEVDPFPDAVAEQLTQMHEATLAGHKERSEVAYEGRDYEVRTAPIRDDDGDVVAGLHISQEISERKRRQEELERQNERLDEFASIVSHDLRNPLNMASDWLELARRECASEALDEIEHAHDRMRTLIENLLTLARQDEMITDREPVDLGAAVEDCWHTVDTHTAALENAADRVVYADRSQLKQLIENLVRNSVEHGTTGADADSQVTITVDDLADGFYLTDDGSGIPAEERERVFDSGYTGTGSGTGFGLYIVEKIADAHGWDVAVTEGQAGGTRVEITGVANAETRS